MNFQTWKQNFEQVNLINYKEKEKKEPSIAMNANNNSNEEQKEEEKVGSASLKKPSNVSDTQESYLIY